ncbi:MAG TPA: helix-turn-helix transcriptional regulator [Solirubrobacteraceae bacterium]
MSALWQLARTSSRLLCVAETPGHMEHPEWYCDVLADLDVVRELLDALGWDDTVARPSAIFLRTERHRALLASILAAAAAAQRRRPGERAGRRELRGLISALEGSASPALAPEHRPAGPLLVWTPGQRLGLQRRIDVLTVREREVLVHLSEARRYPEIALLLCIDVETVRTHARRVRRKLGVRRSRELAGVFVPGINGLR